MMDVPANSAHVPAGLTLSEIAAADAVVLAATGYIDAETYPDFQRKMQEIVERNPSQIVLDFQGITFTNSVTWGLIISLQKKLNQAGGRLTIAGLNPPAATVVHVLGLEELLTISPTVQEALGDTRPAAPK